MRIDWRPRSTLAGAFLGAVLIVAATAAAVGVSGHFEIFRQDRGFLQLLIAIPVACLATAGGLAFLGVLSSSQMMWAMVPVGGLILLGSGLLGPGYRAWPWALGIGAVVLVPWAVGVWIGSSLARRNVPRE